MASDPEDDQAPVERNRVFLTARRYQTELAIRSLRDAIDTAPADARQELTDLLERLETRLRETLAALSETKQIVPPERRARARAVDAANRKPKIERDR